MPVEKMTDAITLGDDPRRTPLGDRKIICFSATLAAQRAGVVVVVATGDNITEIDTINMLVGQQEEKKTAVPSPKFLLASSSSPPLLPGWLPSSVSTHRPSTLSRARRCHDPRRFGSHCHHDVLACCLQHGQDEFDCSQAPRRRDTGFRHNDLL